MPNKRARTVIIGTAVILAAGIAGIFFVFNGLVGKTETEVLERFGEQQQNLAVNLREHIQSHYQTAGNKLSHMIHDGIPGPGMTGEERADRLAFLAIPDYLYLAVADAGGRVEHLYFSPDNAADPSLLPPLEVSGIPADTAFPLILALREVRLPAGDSDKTYRTLEVAIPITENGRPSGWVALGTDFQMVERIISNQVDGEDSHNWIFTHDGKLVLCTFFPSQEYHDMEIDLLLNNPPGTYEGSLHKGDHTQRDLITSVKLELGLNKWLLVVENNIAYITGFLKDANRLSALLLTVVFGVASLAAFFFYRYAASEMVAQKTSSLLSVIGSSERKYRSIFNTVADPVMLVDHSLYLLDLNKSAASLFGTSLQEKRDHSLEELFKNNPATVEEIRKRIHNSDETGVDLHLTANSGEEMYFSLRPVRLDTPAGAEELFLIYMQNVTEHRLLEQRLQREKENLDKLISSIDAGLAVYDRNKTLTWANRNFRDMLAASGKGPDHTPCPSALEETLDTGATNKREIETGTREDDHGRQTYMVVTTPVYSTGKLTDLVQLFINITELLTLKEKLLHAEKLAALGELVAGIAHELNNPITGIIGNAEFLIEDLPDGEQKEDARKIHSEARRCSKIISGLLTFARSKKENYFNHPPMDPVRGAIHNLEPEIEKAGITVEQQAEPDLPDVYGDALELQQVYLNILTNAVHVLEEQAQPGKITITGSHKGGWVEIRLINNGKPIPDEAMGRIFDPFYTTKEVGRGTGLGLSISHGIIRAHEGELSVHNIDGGVEFRVELPAATKAAKA